MTRWASPRARWAGIPDAPDVELNRGVVSDQILDAYEKLSVYLNTLGIQHTLVGGLAVGAWGYPRATRDIDILVYQNEVFDGTVFLSFKPGIPISVDGVAVDYLTVEGLGLRGAIQTAVVPLPLLFAMKLKAKRPRDDVDLMELLQSGADIKEVDAFLVDNGLTKERARFLALVARVLENDE